MREVELLTTKELGEIVGTGARMVIDAITERTFFVCFAGARGDHYDVTPATESDAHIMEEIFNPHKPDINATWRARPTVLVVDERHIAFGLCWFAHHIFIGGGKPTPRYKSYNEQPPWTRGGGHYCGYVINSVGGAGDAPNPAMSAEANAYARRVQEGKKGGQARAACYEAYLLSLRPDSALYAPPNITTPSTGVSHLQRVWNFFKSKGLSDPATAAVFGNLQRESSPAIDPAIVEKPSGEGHGIAQWSFGRKKALFDAAKAQGVDWFNLEFQLNFMWSEMITPDIDQRLKGVANWDDKGAFMNTLKKKGAKPLKNGFADFIQMQNVEAATIIFEAVYFRSNDKIEPRIKFAKTALEKYGGDPEPVKPETPKMPTVHIVSGNKEDGNLTRIAEMYKTTVDAIMAINPHIKDRNTIWQGMRINIPCKLSAPASQFKEYKVRVNVATSLRVRSGAGTNHAHIRMNTVSGNLHTGTILTVIAEANGTGAKRWGRVLDQSGNVLGWVALDFCIRI